MKSNIFIILNVFFCFTIFLSWTSCKDNKEEEDFMVRTFRPTRFGQSTTINPNVVTFEWDPMSNCTYQLQISRDSFEFVRDLTTFPIGSVMSFTLEDYLWSDSRYSARIKAINNDPAIPESGWSQITWKTGIENIFITPVPAGDIDVNQVTLKWTEGKQVTRILVTSASSSEVSVSLTAADIAAAKKTITNLQGAVAYTFQIFKGDMLRGTVTVTTKAAPGP